MIESRPFTVIIPARYAARRFPGKPLARIAGKYMLQYVYEQACQSRAAAVYIATDDRRIVRAAERFGAIAIMTSAQLVSGTERVYAAARSLQLGDEDVIVNVQGDEPLIAPANIDQVAALLSEAVDIASLVTPIENKEDLRNLNCVKVVSDCQGGALYFSRSVIPYGFDDKDYAQWQRHIGIYSYSMAFLTKYVRWLPCSYETLERLEQLRALYYGARIQLAVAQTSPAPGVDRPEDLKIVEDLIDRMEE